ncbi:hypothetical protein BU26DRAFT_565314 [Trematosphaeria pertusa]|uniref:Uncharacterized protein n=1 Tax=Trematosphaeria pertusa TaxID=390896 RepID=A0A6A6ICV1_9PLEO|nr:uncharacterized protein BU26DRAFT_565314 [Trematosphaeria pertusa]KAF2247888.1 hypothetical protein BU26DRAFT_565314 [Trematosphaeria pertusa]
MAEETSFERYTSYGRGGAGNLRRPSAVEEATKKLASMAEEVATKPRRSSTWSMNSNGERRGSIASLKNLFRRGSNAEEVEKIEE